MRVPIPRNDAFPQFQLIVRTPAGQRTVTVDDTHREVNIPLPADVNEDDVEIVGLFLGRNGQPVPGAGPVLIKEAVVRPAAAPESEPVVEPRPATEPAVEVAAESASEPEPEYPRRRRKPLAAAAEAASET